MACVPYGYIIRAQPPEVERGLSPPSWLLVARGAVDPPQRGLRLKLHLMKGLIAVSLVVASGIFLTSLSAQAQQYQCLDLSGLVFYSSQPCPAGMEYSEGGRPAPAAQLKAKEPSGWARADSWLRADSASPWEVQGQLKGGHLVVKGTLNKSVTIEFTVDTGATLILIPLPLARELGIRLGPDSPIIVATVATGEPVVNYLVSLDQLKIGPVTLSHVLALISSHEKAPPLLGQNFLQQFKVAFDNQKAAMLLDDPDGPEADRYGGFGWNWWRARFSLLKALAEHAQKNFDFFDREYLYARSGAVQEKRAYGQRRAALNTLDFVKAQQDRLEQHARSNKVPRDWREGPVTHK